MRKILKFTFTLLLCLLAMPMIARAADDVTFEAAVPMIVHRDQPFRIEFTLNAKPDDESFVPPTFEGFEVVAGPSVSQGQSIQIINGEMTKSVNYAITYVLIARAEGEQTIGEARIKVEGKSYATRPTPLEVRAGEESSSQQDGGRSQQRNETSVEERAVQQLGKDDLMLRLILSKSEAYKGEAVRAVVKLYSRVNVVGSEQMTLPTFNGFWTHQLETEQGPFRESYNGKVYEAFTLAEYLLYPQQGGVLTIEPAELTVVVQMFVKSNSPINHFFGNSHEVYNLRRKLTTPTVKLRIREFPQPVPASFTGAVGKFDMQARLQSSQIMTNSATNIICRISGRGNINLLQSPIVHLPQSFELYDVKSSEQIHTSQSGSTGYRQYDYPFIARAEGDYAIEPIEFTYFDPEAAKFVTLRSNPLDIKVLPDGSSQTAAQQGGLTGGVIKEDVRLLSNEIRFIKLGKSSMHRLQSVFLFSAGYFIVIAALVVVALAAYLFIRRRQRDSRNVVLMRGRRANKVAVQRFRKAKRYMEEQNRRAFYDEMLQALWGYASDKFNIPIADLTKESMRDYLSRRGSAELAREMTTIISECEEAQYSPVEVTTMDEQYARGIDIVSKIESIVKR